MHSSSPLFRLHRSVTLFAALALTLLATLPTVAAQPLKLVVLGDSLTAGFQLPRGAGFPEQLQQRLQARGHKVDVINAGVSGDTTAAGLARLNWAVPKNANAVIVELGGNDALRGIDLRITRRNLDRIIKRLKGKGMRVLLAGVEVPRNLGPRYVKGMRAMYRALARQHEVPLYPNFLKGAVLNPKLMMADRIHPKAAGVKRMVASMLPTIERFLVKIR